VGGSAQRAATGFPCDFIMLPAPVDGMDALLAAARDCRAQRPGITLVATGLASIDDVEQALQAGVTLVAGRVDATRGSGDVQPLQTAVQHVCQLLNRVATDQDTALIAKDISVDVPLSYRMLRYVNSPALGLSRGVDSVEQAVMLLGRKELYRWLSVLLLSSAGGRRASRALQEISLARARLLETLARERGADPPDALFTVGLLSLLDVMLQRPLDDALAPLNLGDKARRALLEREGDWHEYLALAADLERHDMDAAAARAAAFGGLEHVVDLAEQAWRWAAAVHGEMHAQGPGVQPHPHPT
jgi:EAL and modified HD-GYP domain-containing signal transduction protein